MFFSLLSLLITVCVIHGLAGNYRSLTGVGTDVMCINEFYLCSVTLTRYHQSGNMMLDLIFCVYMI